jgi:hypothetical protein
MKVTLQTGGIFKFWNNPVRAEPQLPIVFSLDFLLLLSSAQSDVAKLNSREVSRKSCTVKLASYVNHRSTSEPNSIIS